MNVVRALRSAYVASGLRALLPMRAKFAGRGLWVLIARTFGYPVSSPRLPRPPLERRRVRMRLTHVLVASDLNPRYLESWSLARRGWTETADLEPLLVLVADEAEAPAELLADPCVRRFQPIPGLHTAFQAQCIRLLYPALLDAAGAVLISDMELVPLDPGYFHDTVAGLDERFFAAYRGEVLFDRGEISIPYNAARPQVWSDIFCVRSLDDVRARLREWAVGLSYEGTRGGKGWYTDQLVLHERLLRWARHSGRLWLMDDQYTGYRRLEREAVLQAGGLTAALSREIRGRRFTDFDSCVPHSSFAAVNDAVLDLALASRARSRRRLASRA
jgi:hypothetical protein